MREQGLQARPKRRRRSTTRPGRGRSPAPDLIGRDLVAFAEADWLPLVDPAGYDPEEHRDRGPDGPYGPPRWTFEAWRRRQAWTMWSRTRLDWRKEHGWPGGPDYVELMQQTVRTRRQAARVVDPVRVEHG